MNRTPEIQAQLDQFNAPLNDEQKQAAEQTFGPLMVLAGAGAGKTKTLIHHVGSKLIEGAAPTSIMMITFTNKAAEEIKHRLEGMIGEQAQYVTAGTFHSVVYRHILKRYPESDYLKGLGIEMAECSILDEDDMKSMMNTSIDELDDEDKELIDENDWSVASFMGLMTLERASGRDVNDFAASIPVGAEDELQRRVLVKIWRKYNVKCRDAGGIDFDDILLVAKNMLKREPHIAKELSETFKHIMVDEYQDTNLVQMNVVESIVEQQPEGQQNFTVVGDEGQSIYMFRGANIHNILNFTRRFKDVVKVYLTRNYRSKPEIVRNANACRDAMNEKISDTKMISMATVQEHQKNHPLINKAHLLKFKTDIHEAENIVKAIVRDLQAGIEGKEIAVLYRGRNNKRQLEKILWEKNIPYYVVGDTAFFKKAEVKDIISMIRFVFNPWDSLAGLRFLRSAKIGISEDRAKRAMADEGLSVFAFLKNEADRRIKFTKKNPEGELSATARRCGPFVELAEELRKSVKYQDSVEFIRDTLAEIWDIYQLPAVQKVSKRNKESENDLDERIANVNVVMDRLFKELDDGKSVEEIVEELTLMTEHNPDLDKDMDRRVRLMTIHASKGLEFDNVYVIASDDDNMPGDTEDFSEIEESRRLFYVAMTRAKNKLVVSCSLEKQQFGKLVETIPSRFMREVERNAQTKIVSIR